MTRTPRTRPLRALALLLLLATLAPGSARAEDDRSALVALNKVFRAAYADAMQHTLDQTGPLFVCDFVRIHMYRDGQWSTREVDTSVYDLMKQVSHAVLAIHLMLAPYGDGPIEPARLERLRQHRALMRASLEQVKATTLVGPADRDRLAGILAAALEFTGWLEERGELADPTALVAFVRAQVPAIEENFYQASKSLLSQFHAIMRGHKKDIPDEEWRRAKVAILGVHQPRVQNAEAQYFRRLFQDDEREDRVVFAEMLSFERAPEARTDARALVGRVMLDKLPSEAFFGSPYRLQIDALAYGARRAVAELDFSGFPSFE